MEGLQNCTISCFICDFFMYFFLLEVSLGSGGEVFLVVLVFEYKKGFLVFLSKVLYFIRFFLWSLSSRVLRICGHVLSHVPYSCVKTVYPCRTVYLWVTQRFRQKGLKNADGFQNLL
jgi:hypothetical protein